MEVSFCEERVFSQVASGIRDNELMYCFLYIESRNLIVLFENSD